MNTLTQTSASTSIRDAVDKMGQQEIELRRTEILQAAKGDYETLSTEQLHELAYIAQKLRRTSVGPPKEAKVKVSKAPKSIDDLI